jgi:hypothetical protein
VSVSWLGYLLLAAVLLGGVGSAACLVGALVVVRTRGLQYAAALVSLGLVTALCALLIMVVHPIVWTLATRATDLGVLTAWAIAGLSGIGVAITLKRERERHTRVPATESAPS